MAASCLMATAYPAVVPALLSTYQVRLLFIVDKTRDLVVFVPHSCKRRIRTALHIIQRRRLHVVGVVMRQSGELPVWLIAEAIHHRRSGSNARRTYIASQTATFAKTRKRKRHAKQQTTAASYLPIPNKTHSQPALHDTFDHR